MNPLQTNYRPDVIMKLQTRQYNDKMVLSGEIEAGQSNIITADVSNLGHFYVTYFTGDFSTLALNEGVIVDDGVSHLRGQLRDGSNSKNLFSDFTPLNLIMSPGRVKNVNSVNVLIDPPSNNLFYPFPFFYMFTVNSKVILEVKNDSDTKNYVNLILHGVRVLKDL